MGGLNPLAGEPEYGLMILAHTMLQRGAFIPEVFRAECMSYAANVNNAVKSSILPIYRADSIEELEQHRADIEDFAVRSGYSSGVKEESMSDFLSNPEVMREISARVGQEDAEKALDEIAELEHQSALKKADAAVKEIEAPTNIPFEEEKKDMTDSKPRRAVNRTASQNEVAPSRQVRRAEQRSEAKASAQSNKEKREALIQERGSDLLDAVESATASIGRVREKLSEFMRVNNRAEDMDALINVSIGLGKAEEGLSDIIEAIGIDADEEDVEDEAAFDEDEDLA